MKKTSNTLKGNTLLEGLELPLHHWVLGPLLHPGKAKGIHLYQIIPCILLCHCMRCIPYLKFSVTVSCLKEIQMKSHHFLRQILIQVHIPFHY